jgi:hypothetical protein
MSITLLGITQEIPKRVKRVLHKAEATSQWRRKWSTDSPLLLHKQHLSTIITCLFLRLSKVRILPRVAGHTKKAAFKGARVRHTLFQGKRLLSEQSQGAKGLNLEQTSFGRDPPKPIFTTSSHNDWVQHLKKIRKDIHFPIMHLSRKAQVPLIGTAQKLQILRNKCILSTSNTR